MHSRRRSCVLRLRLLPNASSSLRVGTRGFSLVWVEIFMTAIDLESCSPSQARLTESTLFNRGADGADALQLQGFGQH